VEVYRGAKDLVFGKACFNLQHGPKSIVLQWI